VVDLLKMKRHHLGRGLTSMKFDYREILLNELVETANGAKRWLKLRPKRLKNS
jgi:hypothetical protein